MATSSSHPPRSGYRLDGAPPRATSELMDALRRATTVEEANGRAALDPAAVAKPGSAERHSKGGIEGLIGRRVAAATEHALEGPNQTLMRAQRPVWDVLCRYYFRLELSGWERLPEEPSLLIGNHSGGSLTMDAWTFVAAWWRRFGAERVLHATAHDVLMAAPGLGDYFRQVGVIPASRQGVTAALSAGCDVIIWPGVTSTRCATGAGAMRLCLLGARGSYARRFAQACRSFPWPPSAGTTPYSSYPRAAGLRTGSTASAG
jgi:Acyltransferase